MVFVEQCKQFPKIWVRDGVAGNVKIGQTVVNLAKIKAVIKGVLQLLPIHRINFFASV